MPRRWRPCSRQERPDAVLHLAANPQPDFCEEHPDEAKASNVDSTASLCAALPASVPLILASTDYVFDGSHPPYAEDAERRPVNVYGATKVAAEDLVRQRAGARSSVSPC
jgi:dTDP-4-dehydrorhamnose reductase